ncbi:hypothetical protein [Caloramator australicus]|uniref:Uncharacterized protein n=1 Tax=Caloramator australicus RC3 TaxID=857293 RepID=I7LJK9_9CLOT|nr:hypothetical protein [Caloramator australicus]CCJ33793.1 hypothetical protein CAAU_1709 [Caloramator australicus RC3]
MLINVLKEKIDGLAKALDIGNTEEINLFIIKIIDDLILFSNNINESIFDVNFFNEKLNEMLSAMKEGDYYLFLDVLKYELMPIIEEYLKLSDN